MRRTMIGVWLLTAFGVCAQVDAQNLVATLDGGVVTTQGQWTSVMTTGVPLPAATQSVSIHLIVNKPFLPCTPPQGLAIARFDRVRFGPSGTTRSACGRSRSSSDRHIFRFRRPSPGHARLVSSLSLKRGDLSPLPEASHGC